MKLMREKLLGAKSKSDPHLVDRLYLFLQDGALIPVLKFRDHLKLMLENTFTLPRHIERNGTLAESIGKKISWT